LGIVTPPVCLFLLVHCPIIAEVSYKINTFFQKNANIFLFLALTRAGCGVIAPFPQDIEVKKNDQVKNFLVKRKNFGEKQGLRQNAEKKSVTILSRFFISVMLTEQMEKVRRHACGKTCGECGKLKIFNRILLKGAFPYPGKNAPEKFAKVEKDAFCGELC